MQQHQFQSETTTANTASMTLAVMLPAPNSLMAQSTQKLTNLLGCHRC